MSFFPFLFYRDLSLLTAFWTRVLDMVSSSFLRSEVVTESATLLSFLPSLSVSPFSIFNCLLHLLHYFLGEEFPFPPSLFFLSSFQDIWSNEFPFPSPSLSVQNFLGSLSLGILSNSFPLKVIIDAKRFLRFSHSSAILHAFHSSSCYKMRWKSERRMNEDRERSDRKCVLLFRFTFLTIVSFLLCFIGSKLDWMVMKEERSLFPFSIYPLTIILFSVSAQLLSFIWNGEQGKEREREDGKFRHFSLHLPLWAIFINTCKREEVSQEGWRENLLSTRNEGIKLFVIPLFFLPISSVHSIRWIFSILFPFTRFFRFQFVSEEGDNERGANKCSSQS